MVLVNKKLLVHFCQIKNPNLSIGAHTLGGLGENTVSVLVHLFLQQYRINLGHTLTITPMRYLKS